MEKPVVKPVGFRIKHSGVILHEGEKSDYTYTKNGVVLAPENGVISGSFLNQLRENEVGVFIYNPEDVVRMADFIVQDTVRTPETAYEDFLQIPPMETRKSLGVMVLTLSQVVGLNVDDRDLGFQVLTLLLQRSCSLGKQED